MRNAVLPSLLPPLFISSVRPLFTFIAALFTVVSAHAADSGLKVSVAEQSLHFRWAQPKTGRVEIRELPLNTDADLARETRTLMVADAAAG